MAEEKKNKKKKVTRKRKTKSRKKFINNIMQIVLLSAIICLIAYTVYSVAKFIVKPSDALVVDKGTISEIETVDGYIIRNEVIVNSQNADTEIIEIKSEGAKVAKGEEIFRYKITNESEISTQIEELNNKIQEALEGQTNLFQGDIKALDAQIDKILGKTMMNNNIQTITENKKEITNYLTKKAKIAGELSPADSYINGLIAQKTELENRLSNESNNEISPMSGVVSYRVDGLETELNANKLSEITIGYLEGLNLKTGQIISKNTSKGKVLNSFSCYIAVVRKIDDKHDVKVGDKITLRTAMDSTIKSTVQDIKEENGKQLIILEITKGVEELIKYRKISLDIVWWEKEGVRVPKSSIIYENGLSYVVRNRAGVKTKILVKILKENDNYSIIGNYKVEELKELGFSATEIPKMSQINIYDEILVNPDMREIAN
jgi:hypothetical protein